MSCLTNVIGLSQTTCNCVNIDGNANANLSGQYVDNLEHGINLKALSASQDCGDDGLWQLMAKARLEAVEDFKTQLMMAVSSYGNTKFSNYLGFAGEKDRNNGNSSIIGLDQRVGQVLKPSTAMKGASMIIRSIELGINNPDEYFVEVINLSTNETITTVVIDTRSSSSVDTDIELDLVDYGQPINYAFAYNRKIGAPKNYRYHCGCPSQPLPNWNRDNYLDWKGFSTSSTIEVSKANSQYTNGLIINFELQCKLLDWLCDKQGNFWTENTFGRIAAKAMVLIANVKLAQKILKSENINYYTLMGVEDLLRARNKFSKLASDLITLLSTDYLPDEIKQCMICDNERQSGGFQKQEILA